jgi:hypothetical protein
MNSIARTQTRAEWPALAIPESWLERLAMRELITEMADSLGALSESQ